MINKGINNIIKLSGVSPDDIIKSSPFGIIATDTNGRIVSANDKAGLILKTTSEQLSGNIASCLKMQAEASGLLSKKSASFIIERDGKRVLVSKGPIHSGRKVSGMVYTIHDLSKLSENMLPPSQLQCNMESLIESSHDGIILIDHEKIVRVNNSYLRISGLKKNEVEGMKISSLSDNLHI
ncbi:MAG: PAS domain-containing protein [Nitrospirota bacterium]